MNGGGPVVCPGRFDPVTLGHLDLFRRARGLFGDLVVAVAAGPTGRPALFTAAERAAMIRDALAGGPAVTVVSFHGLLVDCLRAAGARTVVRGLRLAGDFEHEWRMAQVNRRLLPGLETVFLPAAPEFVTLSSSLVREIAMLGGDVSALVSPVVARRLAGRFPEAGR